jgi:hypothetical protein
MQKINKGGYETILTGVLQTSEPSEKMGIVIEKATAFDRGQPSIVHTPSDVKMANEPLSLL